MAKRRTKKAKSDVLTRIYQKGSKRLRKAHLKSNGIDKSWAKRKVREYMEKTRAPLQLEVGGTQQLEFKP